MSGTSAEIFGLLAFSLTTGVLFSRTVFGLLESWLENARNQNALKRRRG